MPSTGVFAVVLVALASLSARLYPSVALRVKLFGISRIFSGFENIHGEDFTVFPDTFGCEDIHYHEAENLLFGVSEATVDSRVKWFPPSSITHLQTSIEHWDISEELPRGNIFMMHPKDKKPTPLTLTGFEGPFVTHGIDIWSEKGNAEYLYIFAVNHLRNPAYPLLNTSDSDVPRSRSQIEVFQHKFGTQEARYLRSIRHPLIRTPNDIYAVDARSIYVTNDHYYREGLLRFIEDIGLHQLSPWSDVVHVSITDLNSADPSSGIQATVALNETHNPNGLGHGRTDNEILIGRAAAGVVEIARLNPHSHLEILDSIQFPTTIDNPFYFHDPYAKETGRDASGFVIAGLARAVSFPSAKDPVNVWFSHPAAGQEAGRPATWQQRLLFQDDGAKMHTVSVAVLVAIPPKENGGKKQAWLFVTGPFSKAMIRVIVDL